MTRQEKIRELLQMVDKYYYCLDSDIERHADAILALPLDVPSDKEIMQKYPFSDEDIDLISNLDNQEGAKWMKEEIIKRNK